MSWSIYSYLCIISCDTLLNHYRLLRFRIIAILCRRDLEIIKKMRERLKSELERLIKKKKVDDLYRQEEDEGEVREQEQWYSGLETEEFMNLMM